MREIPVQFVRVHDPSVREQLIGAGHQYIKRDGEELFVITDDLMTILRQNFSSVRYDVEDTLFF